MSTRRVAVTGIGLVTPFGPDRETSWSAIREGRSATRWLTVADGPEWADHSCDSHCAIGAPVSRCLVDTDPAAGLPSAAVDPVTALALTAAQEAVSDARLDMEVQDRHRVGCVFGTSKGGLRSFQRAWSAFHNGDAPFPAEWWTQFLPNTPALAMARLCGARGPALCPVAACATGLLSLARGAELVRDGHCDIVLAGSSDASLLPMVLSSFRRLGVLAKCCEDPSTACRPFDRRRNGFVIGEGAAVLVMEPLDAARARGAAIYAEWLAAGTAADAVGLTELDPRAEGLAWLIRDVLRRAGVAAEEIDYVNLHGTATVQNDRCETRAIHAAFGPAAKQVVTSSLKGGLGHLLGAAGSVETAATLLAMRDGVVPPTVNLSEPDADCDLDFTPRTPRRRHILHALKLSLGFGGHLVAAVLRRAGDAG